MSTCPAERFQVNPRPLQLSSFLYVYAQYVLCYVSPTLWSCRPGVATGHCWPDGARVHQRQSTRIVHNWRHSIATDQEGNELWLPSHRRGNLQRRLPAHSPLDTYLEGCDQPVFTCDANQLIVSMRDPPLPSVISHRDHHWKSSAERSIYSNSDLLTDVSRPTTCFYLPKLGMHYYVSKFSYFSTLTL